MDATPTCILKTLPEQTRLDCGRVRSDGKVGFLQLRDCSHVSRGPPDLYIHHTWIPCLTDKYPKASIPEGPI